MKKMNLVIAVVVVAICLFGWFSVIGGETSKHNQYSDAIELADSWVEEGLYQRAILKYQEAIDQEADTALYDKAIAAYQMRMAEVSDEVLKDTRAEYIDFLEEAAKDYPAVEIYARMLGELLIEDEDYDDAYAVLRNAVDNGVASEAVLRMMRQARYAADFRGGTYTAILPLTGNTYSVMRTGLWGSYSAKDGTVLGCEYIYASQSNPEGVQIVTNEKDSRLINGDGLVMGIFAEKVTDAGLFAEGLIPASCDGVTYDYYDEYARKQFGGYEMAGTFSNGVAAVKQNGLWFLIDGEGNKISDAFDQIVLKNDRSHISGKYFLASQNSGTYTIFETKLKAQVSFDAEAVDVLTDDGLIAFCRGGKWGFVDLAGTVVIEPCYAQARSFSSGLAAVYTDQWGFIDPTGTMVIEPQFTDALYFDDQGYCPVRVDQPTVTAEDVTAYIEQVSGETVSDATEPTDAAQSDGTEAVEQETCPEEWRLLKLKLGIMED